MRKHIVTVIATVALACSSPAYGQTSEPLVPCDWLYNIKARINGTEMPFVMDTGATTVGIPEAVGRQMLAQGIITPEDSIGVQEMVYANGTIVQVPTYNIRDLEIAGIHIRNVEATFNNSAPLIGILAMASLSPFVVGSDKITSLAGIAPGDTINSMTRDKLLTSSPLTGNGVSVPLTVESHVYFTKVDINGCEVDMMIDTGASRMTVSSRTGRYLLENGHISREDLIGQYSSRDGNGNRANGYRYYVRSLTIGGITVKDVEMNVSPDPNARNILGMSALSSLMPIAFCGDSLMICDHAPGDTIAARKQDDFDRIMPLVKAGMYAEAQHDAEMKASYSYSSSMRDFWLQKAEDLKNNKW